MGVLLISFAVFMLLLVMAGIYALWLDPKRVDEEEKENVQLYSR